MQSILYVFPGLEKIKKIGFFWFKSNFFDLNWIFKAKQTFSITSTDGGEGNAYFSPIICYNYYFCLHFKIFFLVISSKDQTSKISEHSVFMILKN